MSSNFNPPNPIRPLSVGNVVSSALVLYRSHLKLFLGLAFKSILWSIIPIYGWAKAATINAQISRLAFCELIDKPESASSAEDRVTPKMWSFLLAGILVGLIIFGVNMGISLVATIIIFIPATLILASSRDSAAGSPIFTLLQVVVNLVSWAVQLWFQARFLIPELPLAVESNVDATGTVSRSRELTKGSGVRIQLILLVAYLITAPIALIAAIPLFFALGSLIFLGVQSSSASASPEAGLVLIGSILAFIVLLIVAGVLTIPFWQTIKAVIYYDLRSRREGMDLQIRDRNVEM
ncbi:hypothetical protein ACE1CD_31135 [Aerosakkonema sp. BLCC-F183]|uniref:hypothetical protein n=1 Tax=Aerosakkonema sp. BLCC-F183 TaxID=3342834 RepID=UPI0035BB2F79